MIARLLILMARAWQIGPSRILPPSCRYQPSCSAYAAEAVARRIVALEPGRASGEQRIVEALLARRLDPDLPVMRAIGVPEIADWLAGRIDRDTMIAAGAQATRRYAKRQYTWFAHQPPADWPRFTMPLDDAEAVERALALLGGEA